VKKEEVKKENTVKEEVIQEEVTPKPKKENSSTPLPNISAPEPKLPDDEDLPDWLK